MVSTLLITAGSGAILVGAVVAWRALRSARGPQGWVALLWLCFGSGLILQALAPNLKVEQAAFVVPAPTRAGAMFDPRGVVEREKRMQVLALLLTSGAALGLCRSHRSLFGRA